MDTGYKDFIPAPLSLPPAATEFQSYEKLLVNLNRWLKQAQLTNIVGLQSIEIPFHSKTLGKLALFSLLIYFCFICFTYM